MAGHRDEKLTDKSLTELLRQLSQQTVTLVREELELAEAEAKEAGMGDTVEALAHKADVRSRASEAAAEGEDKVVGRVTESKQHAVQAVTGEAEHVRQKARQAGALAEENALGLVLGSVAVGFLVGMIVPTTKVEDRRLGPPADELKERAKETGEEALGRAKEVAQQTPKVAEKSAHEAARRAADTASLDRPRARPAPRVERPGEGPTGGGQGPALGAARAHTGDEDARAAYAGVTFPRHHQRQGLVPVDPHVGVTRHLDVASTMARWTWAPERMTTRSSTTARFTTAPASTTTRARGWSS